MIPEGNSFRVLLDPTADAQAPEGAGSGGEQGKNQTAGPLKAGRSRFLIVASGLIAAGTAVALYKALESPDRP